MGAGPGNSLEGNVTHCTDHKLRQTIFDLWLNRGKKFKGHYMCGREGIVKEEGIVTNL